MKNNFRGQTLLETITSLSLLFLVFTGGFVLCMQYSSKLILTKWAAFHSRCMATIENQIYCDYKIKSELTKYFYLRNILIHQDCGKLFCESQIKAQFLSRYQIAGFYKLGTSEFKRTHNELR